MSASGEVDRRPVHRYALLVALACFCLVLAGGLVTSHEAGLAVPDWPLSYGKLMPDMGPKNVRLEHGHRMIATAVGLVTVGLAVLLWRREPRGWVRRLGWAALGAVVAQGTLGGLTVLFLLPLPVSVAHACLGQLFFTLTVVLAVVTSRSWLAGAPAEPHADAPALHGWTLVTALAVFVQLVLGALVRHFPDASLAIPTFPLAFGRLVPPDLTPPVAVQFAHRVFALVVFSLAVATTVRVCRRHGDRAALVLPSLALGLLVLFQGMLGGAVVLTGAAPWTATAHQTLGAVILAVSVVQAFQARRCCREPVPQAVPA